MHVLIIVIFMNIVNNMHIPYALIERNVPYDQL